MQRRWQDRWVGPHVPRRLPGLVFGLALFGAGIAVMVAAGVGLGPWEAFHQGIARLTSLQIGTVSMIVGVPILLGWMPLREVPGLGTALNVLCIGLATNLALPLLPRPDQPVVQAVMSASGIVLIAIGSGFYLGADLGPGPRDGLMTGLHHRFGWSIRRARTVVELSVLAVGFVLGGSVGLGTLMFTFGIGPLVQVALRVIDREGRVARRGGAEFAEAIETPGMAGD